MELAKCARCGKLYNRVKLPVCPPCEMEEEKEILTVQVYMRDHPGDSLEDVSNATNIYVEDIERWITEKRLTVVSTQGAVLKCIICGAPVSNARICPRCNERLGMPIGQPEAPKPSIRESTASTRERDGGGGGGAAQKYRRE